MLKKRGITRIYKIGIIVALIAIIVIGVGVYWYWTTLPRVPPGIPEWVTKLPPEEKDRVIDLIVKAREEGGLKWTHCAAMGLTDALSEGFRKRYGFGPEFKIEGEGTDWTYPTVEKIISEVEKGIPTYDVIWAGDGWACRQALVDGGYVLDYRSPEWENYPEAVKEAGGKYGISGVGLYYYVAVNSEIIDPNEIKDYWDLIKPEYKGKISICDAETQDVAYDIYAALRQNLGIEYLEELAKLEPYLIDSTDMAASLLVAGEFPITFLGYPPREIEYKKKGAPYQGLFQLPILVPKPFPIYVLKHGANPSAAKLFVDFYLSEEGSAILHEYGYLSARFGAPRPPYDIPAIAEVTALKFDSEEARVIKRDAWMKEFLDFFKPVR